MTAKTDRAKIPAPRGKAQDGSKTLSSQAGSEASSTPAEWARLGTVAPHKLVDACAQLRWAAQTLTAAADVLDLLDPQPAGTTSQAPHLGTDHARLQWSASQRALTGLMLNSLASEGALQIALGVEELALSVIDASGLELHKLALHGYTMAIALAWLSEAISTDSTLRVRSCALPHHTVSRGGRFSTDDSEAFRELAHWYSTGVSALSAVEAAESPGHPAALTIDPQHLTAFKRVPLDATTVQDTPPAVTYGMCPGDIDIAQPYYFVIPSPLPAATELPPLSAGGRWHRLQYPGREIVGAVLTADSILSTARENEYQSTYRSTYKKKGANSRQAIVGEFLQTAIDQCVALLSISI